MNNKQLMCAMLTTMACLAGTAIAQDAIDRRGPNVMPAPHHGEHYSNNSNTYNGYGPQSRRPPNVMQAPETTPQARVTPRGEHARAQTENQTRVTPGSGDRSGPNIVGEPAGLSAEGDKNGRRGEATPGCEKCVAI